MTTPTLDHTHSCALALWTTHSQSHIPSQPGGIDLCLVDPVSGATHPTGAWVQKEGHGTNMIYAATAALDGKNSWSFVTAGFSSMPGLHFMAVDISNKNYSVDRISCVHAVLRRSQPVLRA